MKLMFAIKRLHDAAGGAERVLCMICSELQSRGHDITITTFDRPGAEAFYALDPRVKRIQLGIGDPSRPSTVVETLQRMRALRKTITNESPQVAIGFMHSMFLPLTFALLGTGIPLIGSEHIVPEHYRTRAFQYAMFLAAARFITKITVLSEPIRRRYPTIIRKRMVPMPNPVIVPKIDLGPRRRGKRHLLLNVGRLYPQKDQELLLRAFGRIAAKHLDWDLKIVGEGPLRPALEKLVRKLGLEARVQMPGNISNITDIYEDADLFVTSSRYEALGLVTIEAMSFELPVIGFADCSGTNEIVKHGETGLLAPGAPDRVSSLAMTLETLMSDSDRRRKLGKAGRLALCRTDNSVQRVCDLWERLCAEVVT
jgi:glycosyltransferase involved in cell wall biosynthesis